MRRCGNWGIGLWAVAAAILGMSAAWCGADDAAKEVQGLVRDLESEAIDKRSSAMSRLLELGAADPERILGMLPKESPDKEVEGALAELRRLVPIEAARIQAMKLADDAPLQEWAGFLFDTARGDLRESFPEAISKRVINRIEKGYGDGERVKRKGEAYTRILLLSGLHRHPDVAVRQWTAQMLAHFRRPEAAEALLELAEDPSEAVRTLVLAKMGEMQERTAHLEAATWLLPHLLKGLESPKEGAPGFCGLAILKGKDRSVIPQVLPLLESGKAETQIAAIRTLAGFQHKEAIPGIRKLLSDHRTVDDAKGFPILRVSREALFAISAMEEAGSVPIQCDVLGDEKAKVLHADAVNNLRRWRDQGTLAELEARLKASEESSASAAVYARAILEVMEHPKGDPEKRLALKAQEAILCFETGEGKRTGGCAHRFVGRGPVTVCAECKAAFDASMKRIPCADCVEKAISGGTCGKCGLHWGEGRVYACAGCAAAAGRSRQGGAKLVTCEACKALFYDGIPRPGWISYGDDAK